MTTYGAALADGRARLREAGNDTPAPDARLLLGEATGLDAAALIAHGSDLLPDAALAKFETLLRRRVAGEPVARILGRKEFWGLIFELGPATLVPRPETETLVDVVLREARRKFPPEVTIADLGAGSGAILIALLTELPEARGGAVDISADALAIARRNAERLGVAERIDFHHGDFAMPLNRRFHVIVSNPPYIRSGVIAELQAEVRDHDPRAALDGGPDGLAAYRAILTHVNESLLGDGLVAFEVGYDQADAVMALCRRAGLADVGAMADLAGTNRVVTGRAAVPLGAGAEKNRLEMQDDRASVPTQTRAKPRGGFPFPADEDLETPKAGSLVSPSHGTS